MPPEAPSRSPWRRWIADPVVRQLTQGISPEKIALTLAVGSAIAFFPIVGTATTLCAVTAILLGLNQGIIQGVNALCTVAYLPAILAFVRLGDFVAGAAPTNVDVPAMIDALRHHPGDFVRRFGVTVLHAVLGWAVVALVWTPVAYFAALPALRSAAARIHASRPAGHRAD